MDNKPNKRLLALDIFRGITIAGMILVNNPGSAKYIYSPLRHAQWNGLTLADLVFPFFMFIMGISIFLSFNKYHFMTNGSTLLKIATRTIVLFFIGLILGWLSLALRNFTQLAAENINFMSRVICTLTDIEYLRILGILQRLALTYGTVSLIAIVIKHKYIPYMIVITLISYFLLLFYNNGFILSEQNIIAIIDRALLGANHMYKDSAILFEPEGILSTIPAICQVLIGFYFGKRLTSSHRPETQIIPLLTIGIIMLGIGLIFSYQCPINKKIWSPTFVLITSSLALCLTTILIWIIDVKNYKYWGAFFIPFGTNPLFIYVMAGILATILTKIPLTYNAQAVNIKQFIYEICLQPYLGDYFGSFCFALLFIGLNWIIANILYKKRIYIKI